MVVKYDKINDIQSKIFIDGEFVGWLEKPFRTSFRIEIMYSVIELPANKGHMVTDLIKKTVSRIKSRQRRMILGEERLKNSVLNGYHYIKTSETEERLIKINK
jgi:hypothetical protein